jgi:hypothetical protein
MGYTSPSLFFSGGLHPKKTPRRGALFRSWPVVTNPSGRRPSIAARRRLQNTPLPALARSWVYPANYWTGGGID